MWHLPRGLSTFDLGKIRDEDAVSMFLTRFCMDLHLMFIIRVDQRCISHQKIFSPRSPLRLGSKHSALDLAPLGRPPPQRNSLLHAMTRLPTLNQCSFQGVSKYRIDAPLLDHVQITLFNQQYDFTTFPIHHPFTKVQTALRSEHNVFSLIPSRSRFRVP